MTGIATPSGRRPYDELATDPFGLRAQAPSAATVALRSSDAGLVAGALVALEGWSGEVHLLPNGLEDEVLPGGTVVLDGSGRQANGPPRERGQRGESTSPTTWVVYTSGTTGAPKAVRHTAMSLTRTVVRSAGAASLTWGLLYDPNRMAGLQVLHQGLATGAAIVAPTLADPLAERIRFLRAGGVDALSATPTLWRLILQTPAGGDLHLRQITLGGEIADQAVLDALARRFPGARITHVFASTETGAAFSVTDGRAGFPRRFLDEPPRGVALDVRDGILHVQSPGVGGAGPDGFVSTGDFVEIVGDRVLFKGRASGVVNVGGVNVWPEEVEARLREHPAVADAAVTAKSNPFSGQILTARVVPAPGADAQGLGKVLRGWMRQQVPNAQVPATITVVDALDVSAAGKAARS